MNFSEALEHIKAGAKLARTGWNGKGMFVYCVPANAYPATRNENSTMMGIFPGDLVPYRAYLAMKTAQGDVVPWVASQTDILADDWIVVSVGRMVES